MKTENNKSLWQGILLTLCILAYLGLVIYGATRVRHFEFPHKGGVMIPISVDTLPLIDLNKYKP